MDPSQSRPLKAPSYTTIILTCCTVAFCGYVGSHMRLPVVPLFARSLGADTVQVGIINSAFLLTAGVFSLPFGILSDRVGRKLLAAAGLLVLGATSFLLYFSKTPIQLTWIYLLFGTGLAAFGPTMMSVVADLSPPTHMGRSYGWYTTALYTSMSLGPAIGGYIAEHMGFLRVFLLSGSIILVTAMVVIFLLPRPSHIVPRQVRSRGNMSEALCELMKNRPLVACWLATLGGCFGLGMFTTFLPLHAQNLQIGIGEIGLIFCVQGLCNALSRIPFGHLSDKVARRGDLVIMGLIGFAASMAGFGISHTVLSFMLFAVLLGTGMGLAFTSVGALIAESVPLQYRGLAMGGYNTCIYFGMMLSSAIMGGVIRQIGFENGFFITALINLVLILFFFLLMKDFSREKKEAIVS